MLDLPAREGGRLAGKYGRFVARMDREKTYDYLVPRAAGQDKGTALLVLRDGDQNVKGYASVAVEANVDAPGQRLYLQLLYVARRGLGRGQLLVDAAAKVARANRCDRIDLMALPGAVPFYERLGFVDSPDGGAHMTKRLPRPRITVKGF